MKSSIDYMSKYRFVRNAPFLLYSLLIVPMFVAAVLGYAQFYPMDELSRIVIGGCFLFSLYLLGQGLLFVRAAREIPLSVCFDGSLLKVSHISGESARALKAYSYSISEANRKLPALFFPKGSEYVTLRSIGFTALIPSTMPYVNDLLRLLDESNENGGQSKGSE